MGLLRKILIISGIMVPLAVTAAPPAKLQVENWVEFGGGKYYTMEVDHNSMNAKYVDGGWQLFARLRTKYFYEVQLKDKKQKGSYAISDVLAVCKEDKLVISTSTLYTKTGEPLETLGARTVSNPHVNGNFMTIYLDFMCNQAKNFKPPLST